MAKIKRDKIESVSIGVQNGLTFSCSNNKYFPLQVTFEPQTFKGGFRMIFEDSYSRDDVEALRDVLTEILTQSVDKE